MANRREFIRQAAIGAGALAVSTSAFPNILFKKPKDQIGVALMGLGYYSTDLLAPALQLTKHCKLTGIVTGSPEKAKKWQEKHKLKDKNIYNYDNLDSIANNPDIDVVYVVVPPQGIRAANSRCGQARLVRKTDGDDRGRVPGHD